MSSILRERFIFPMLAFIGAVVAVEVLAFSLSRVLLVGGEVGAPIVALGVAIGILVFCALFAARPRIKSSSLAIFAVIAGLAVVGAGVAAFPKANETKAGETHETVVESDGGGAEAATPKDVADEGVTPSTDHSAH